MQAACDGNPSVPQQNHGRLGWFSSQIEERFNKSVTVETVRKWFAGETVPRPKMMGYLAAVLEVDHAWLAVGSSPQIGEKQKKVRNATADGAVNLVAGLIQICGGHPAFPIDDDARALKNKIDLYAVIKGAQYAFHVTIADLTDDGASFAVPVQSVGEAVVLGVLRKGELDFSFFEIEVEKIESAGKRRGDLYTIQMPVHPDSSWKQITSFSQRL